MRREWSASLLWAESTVILNDPICSGISSPQHGDLVANVLAYWTPDEADDGPHDCPSSLVLNWASCCCVEQRLGDERESAFARSLPALLQPSQLQHYHIGCFFNRSFQFSKPKRKNLLSQWGAFLHWKILEKSSPGWLQLVFHFGTENGKEQLKKHPVHVEKPGKNFGTKSQR